MKMLRLLLPSVILLIFVTGINPAFAQLTRVDTNTQLKAVYLINDRDTDQIRVSAVFLAGEVDFDGPFGLSHYLEHLMFWHADKAGGKEIHGRSGNAWVNGIITSYFNQGVAGELEDLFEFSRRLLDLPTLGKKFMLDEKRVVQREYDLRISENPDRLLFEKMQQELFGDHPARRSVIGTLQSIGSITLDDAFGFHKEFYNPANLVLVISGDLDIKQVRNHVEKAFGNVKAGVHNLQTWRDIGPPGTLETQVELKAGNLESVAYKYTALSHWKGLGERLQDYYTVWMTQKILNSALAGGLDKPLRLDSFVASGLVAGVDPLINGEIRLLFQARPDEGVSLDELSSKFKSALTEIASQGVPDKSVERIRKRLLREAKRRAKEPRYIGARTFELLRLGLEPNDSKDNLRRLIAVKKQDIDKLLMAIATPHRKVDGFLKRKIR